MNKQKYLQIFNYLKEFSELRSKSVRNIEIDSQYSELIWLDNIPDVDLFENIIRDNFNEKNDYWIKIRKPVPPIKPIMPAPPANIYDWIIEDSIYDEEGPQLHESIIKNNEELYLEDFPEIIEEYEKYLYDKWIEDNSLYLEKLEEYKKIKKIYDKEDAIYKKFFRIYNKSQQFGEEYELIIGNGLVNYHANVDSPQILRHVFTQRVDIEFEFSKSNSMLTIKPSLESTPIIETDFIIDLIDHFDTQNILDAEKEVKNYFDENEIYHIFMGDFLSSATQLFADRFSEEGDFKREFNKPKSFVERPELSLAPALALRKRNTKSFTALFNAILDNIDKEDDNLNIPSLNALIDETHNISSSIGEDNNLGEDSPGVFDKLYFPLEYNTEQENIIHEALNKNKVLVQGPPGTGKSHTISNLICHLLASGNKILITAYTKRALEVLKEKLPNEFRNLTVSLLSGDSESIQGLQGSVSAINDKLSEFNQGDYLSDISKLQNELNETKARIAENTNELIKIKEKDFRHQEINDNYSGTLLDISQKLSEDQIEYEWYKDQFIPNNVEYYTKRIFDFINQHNYYCTKDKNELQMKLPKKEMLLTVEDLKMYETAFEYCYSIESRPAQRIPAASCNNYDVLLNYINEIYSLLEKSLNIGVINRKEMIMAFSQNNFNIWEEKIRITSGLVASINDINIREFERKYDIKCNPKLSIKQLKSDSEFWLHYIDSGNSINGIGFNLKKRMLSREYKEKLYLLEEIEINGSPCDTKGELDTLLAYLHIRQVIEELDSIWHINQDNNYYSEKAAYYRNLLENAKKLVKNLQTIQYGINEIQKSSDLRISEYSLKYFKEMYKSVEFCKNENTVNEYDDKINKLSIEFNKSNYHEICDKLLTSCKERDTDRYRALMSELNILLKDQNEYFQYIELLNEIHEKCPLLVEDITNGELPDVQSADLYNAFLYKQAQVEINKLMDSDYENQVKGKLNEDHVLEKELTAELASKKAWVHVVERLRDDIYLRRNLNAWVLAVSKIGKTGRGKRALKFRKEAQALMEKCKSSVPCWVMPLYKIAETIKPEYQMYDYVIIDEASQLGPDAIFLLYIAKRIIIVGDDKQTSPEYVGIKSDAMKPHIERHLKDIPFKQLYGTEFSFFDHAKLFCDGMIVLREHFRCMPEIIEFSNRCFYKPENKSLFPLKQFSEMRLEPLKTVYCQKGYVESSGSRITNPIEAVQIADIIHRMINDSKYCNKTIGVITLQGKQQANLIESEILQKIGETEYHNRKIVCGESASFQGDERDIMFLSLVTATNHNRSALTKPEDERRFNVAASRAKEQAWLIHSVQLEDLSNQNDMRYKLLDHFLNYMDLPLVSENAIERRIGNQPEPFESWFEVDVHNDIISKGYKVIPQYNIANGKYRIDLVVILNNGTKIAVECDGDEFHGPEQYLNDILREKDLERCGWQFFRIRGCKYYANKVNSLLPLWDLLEKNDTKTRSSKQNDKEDSEINDEQDITVSHPYNGSENTDSDEDIDIEDYFDTPKRKPVVDELPIRYLNLYINGDYILTEEKTIETEYCIPIYKSQKNGFLMQCYETGHINKVYVDTLMKKRLNKKYMNGLNTESKLSKIEIINEDCLIGISFTENGIDKFKAHLTEKISCREQLQLKGIKVIYSEFRNIQYYFIPITHLEDIKKLTFESFSASGKAFSNSYYKKEWGKLRELGIFG